MKEDSKFIHKFIHLIKQRPCLYDTTRPDFKSYDRNNQNKAWLEIAQELDETVSDCKEKWKNLRACYSRHLKKLTTATTKHSKPYYLADELDFLLKFMTTKTSNGYERIEEFVNELDSEDPIKIYEDHDESSEPEIVHEPIIKRRRKPSHTNTSKVRVEETAVEEKSPELLGTMSPDLAFLYSLLPDMKEMNNTQKRKFKIGILKLSADILAELKKNSDDSREGSPECHVDHKNMKTY